MPDAEIERCGVRLASEYKLRPGNAAVAKIRTDHRNESPTLEMLSLDPRLEQDRVAGGAKAGPELNVLDRRRRVPLLVESAQLLEDRGANRAQPRPECRCRPRRLRMDVMVEQVAKTRNEVGLGRIVIVGSKDSRQVRVVGESPPDAHEGVAMDSDIRVDEDEQLAHGSRRSPVPRTRGAETGRLRHDDNMLGRLGCGFDRLQASRQRRWPIRSRHDRRQPVHHFDHRPTAARKGSRHNSLNNYPEVTDSPSMWGSALRSLKLLCLLLVLAAGASMATAAAASRPQRIKLGHPVLLAPRTQKSDCTLAAEPDRRCSPGAYSSRLTKRVICSPHFHARNIRGISKSEKHAAEREYGLPAGSYRHALAIDHIVPLRLGGSNNIANLFPEEYAYANHTPGYVVKDRLDHRIRAFVCAGRMPLRTAQRRIAIDWEHLYRRVFGRTPRARR